MLTHSILRYPHPVSGEIRFDLAGEQVRLACRWPADLLTDEWIELSNRFSADDFSRAIRQLRETRVIRIPGERHGELVLTLTDDGKVEMDAVDARASAPPRLIMTLDVPPEAFVLSRMAV